MNIKPPTLLLSSLSLSPPPSWSGASVDVPQEGGRQKEVGHSLSFSVTILVTFFSFLVSLFPLLGYLFAHLFLPIPFCLPAFAAQ